ncbi:MAG: glucose 1-dehydrogenase [Alphaproteobacteria bacterium]|nr:glucose 1-dehydrogenase [Alphaproteobacteria bacterium]MCB9928226.1 glucose 1-dehydrogenase [Alphaproteobacteria bacterium]
MPSDSAADPTRAFRLDGKVALITGASRGLGRGFAETLAAAGATVVLAARGVEQLAVVKDDIEAAGGSAIALQLDVRDKDQAEDAVAAAVEQAGRIDVLVNNSGVAVTRRLLDVSAEDWETVLDTNLTGAWNVAQAVARQMAEDGDGGTIVNISSLLGIRTQPGVVAYGVAKAGLDHLTRVMAMELARQQIRVNSLAPGYILTDLNRAFFETEPGKALIARVPMRRLGLPDDLTGALLFLASDASRYVTGQVLVVDGGHAVAAI